ncbi:MAG TPA: hypothetical protein PLC39_04075 [Methanomassiliicoccales archaeon]|nr:hypothetical protein [Methanomassiliicoccales archaeon]HPR98458.1 hypothetical protein [Methanomassiliicoccales archaeon]
MNIGEFDKKYFSFPKGAVTATVHALKYLAIPYVLFTVGLIVLTGQDGPQRVADLLIELQTVGLIFGIVLTALGFFKGAYPKGSYSRFLFGLTASVLVIVYVFSMLLQGRVQDVIAKEAFELDLYLIFTLYFIPAILAVLMQFGEFADHRRPFLEKEGKLQVKEKEDPQDHRFYHDFRIRYGSLFNGLKLGRSTLTGFVLLPMVVIIILKAGMSSLDVQEVDSALSKLDDVSSLLIMLGVPMAALAFFKGFYPKGSFSRFLPSVIMVLISLYWIWTVGLGGKFVFDAIEDVSIDLDFSKLLLLLMVGTGLWIVYYALELLLYRPEWKKGGFPKDLLEERKARKEAQRKAKEERKAAKEKAKEDKKAAKEKKKADAETPTQDGKEP